MTKDSTATPPEHKDHKAKKPTAHHEEAQSLHELVGDLQRLRADFENYRKRTEAEKDNLRELSKAATVMKLLPVIDNIERAVNHIPAELTENSWAQGIASLVKSLDKSLAELGLVRIDANPDTAFDPNLHEAIAMEDGEGDHEVIAQELRAGYMLGSQIVRPSMVKVTKK